MAKPQSQARSAWDRAAPKEPSRRVRCDPRRCAHPFDFSVGIWQVHESVHVLEQQLELHRTRTFQKEYYLASLRNTAHIWREIALGLAATDQTVPYGTALGVALSQALRARLRSACPSGTKAIRPSKTRPRSLQNEEPSQTALIFAPFNPGLGFRGPLGRRPR